MALSYVNQIVAKAEQPQAQPSISQQSATTSKVARTYVNEMVNRIDNPPQINIIDQLNSENGSHNTSYLAKQYVDGLLKMN